MRKLEASVNNEIYFASLLLILRVIFFSYFHAPECPSYLIHTNISCALTSVECSKKKLSN